MSYMKFKAKDTEQLKEYFQAISENLVLFSRSIVKCEEYYNQNDSVNTSDKKNCLRKFSSCNEFSIRIKENIKL